MGHGSQQADEGGSVWDADEDESACAVEDICNTDDEDDDVYAYVASDARHFSPASFAEDGPESEESDEEEDEENDDPDKFDRHTANMDEQTEKESGLYVNPLSPPPARDRITGGDRLSDPWSTAGPWSTGACGTSVFH